jgi:hypothetical protein
MNNLSDTAIVSDDPDGHSYTLSCLLLAHRRL